VEWEFVEIVEGIGVFDFVEAEIEVEVGCFVRGGSLGRAFGADVEGVQR